MTTRPARQSDSQLRGLKWLLAVGSLAAALLGTRILAANEPVNQVQDPDQPSAVVIEVPVQTQSADGSVQITTKRIELAPVPTAVAPGVRPVVRSRSSR